MGERETRASHALQWFERAKRGETEIVVLKDGRPDWVQDLAHAAHGDMMPDDWRFSFIESALDIIVESEGDEDYYWQNLDAATDVYTRDLLDWVSSRFDRGAYVDEAAEDCGPADSFEAGLMRGQFREREEVLWLVVSFLAEMEDESEEDELLTHLLADHDTISKSADLDELTSKHVEYHEHANG